MASKNSIEYYSSLENGLEEISLIRAIAETAWNTGFDTKKLITADEAYGMAIKQPNVAVTDLPVHEPARKRLNLRKDAKVFIDNHGAIVGRKAKARVFYNLAPAKITENKINDYNDHRYK